VVSLWVIAAPGVPTPVGVGAEGEQPDADEPAADDPPAKD
jgi:hypothetical protein